MLLLLYKETPTNPEFKDLLDLTKTSTRNLLDIGLSLKDEPTNLLQCVWVISLITGSGG